MIRHRRQGFRSSDRQGLIPIQAHHHLKPLHIVWRRAFTFTIFLVVVCVFAASLIAQTKPPGQSEEIDVIKVSTDLLQLRAVVTGKNGKPISGLKQEDFEIIENGRVETPGFFSEERIQSANAPVRVTAPQVPAESGLKPSENVRPVRTIVLFVDTLHLSNLSLLRVKQQLRQFVDEYVTDQDLVEIVTTWSSLGVLEQFIRDRKTLKYAIDRIAGFRSSPSFLTPYIAASALSEAPGALATAMRITQFEDFADNRPPEEILKNATVTKARRIIAEERAARLSTWKVLEAICDQMSSMPGQRIIAFVSDGFTLLDEGMGADKQEFKAATNKAVRSGVVVYAFYPRGLTAPNETNATLPFSLSGIGVALDDGRLDEQNTLRYLAADTGGDAYLNSNDVVGQFKKMLDANSDYYQISYYREDDPKKSLNNIKIRVKGHPEYKVRTQKGYAPPPVNHKDIATTPQERLFQAMIAVLPVTAISVSSTATFVEGDSDDAQLTLQVHFDGATLAYPLKEGKYALNCEVAVAVFDSSGTMKANFEDGIKASFAKEEVDRAKLDGFRYQKRIKLAPGMYQVRIGVRDVDEDQIGTSLTWVTIPNLKNRKLALSSIVLGGLQANRIPSESSIENKPSKVKPVIGSAVFKVGEPVFYHFVVYNLPSDVQSAASFRVRIEVMQSGKTAYEGPWQSLESRIVRRGSSGKVELAGQLRLGTAPGIYTLRVIVDNPKSKQAAEQTIDFELES